MNNSITTCGMLKIAAVAGLAACGPADGFRPQGSAITAVADHGEPYNLVAATASADDGNGADNAIDGELATRWSAKGDGQWLQADLGQPLPVGAVGIAFYKGDQRMALFDVLISDDGKQWTDVYAGSASGTSLELELFDISDATARYVRYVGHGNTDSAWNSVTELRVYAAVSECDGGIGQADPVGDPIDTADSNALQVSTQADLSGGRSLQDAQVSGTVYLFAKRNHGLQQVDFYLDDPSLAGSPITIDEDVPYQLTESGLDTTKLDDGEHRLTAVFLVSSGGWYRADARFTVLNGSSGDAGGKNDRSKVFAYVNFENTPLGSYSDGACRQDFSDPRLEFAHLAGLERYSNIVQDRQQGRVLEAVLPANTVWKGPRIEFRFPDVDEAWLSYKLKFGEGFQFDRLGGKLPGLGAGSPYWAWENGQHRPPQHCMEVEGDAGFSARHQWHQNGTIAQYIYHEDKPYRCGDSQDIFGSTRVFRSGQWYTIVQRVKMNDPGMRNGVIETWVDGRKGATKRLRLRRTDAYGVNFFIFATYFGGSSSKHEHSRVERMYYDDIKVWVP